MANVQKEKGFTAVANEILDQMCRFNFNGSQLRIIQKVWRMTYGYQRKDHEFAVEFLIAATYLSERTIKKEVRALIEANVLLVTKKATRGGGRRLMFNKNYDDWLITKSKKPAVRQIDLFEEEVHETAPDNGKDEVHDSSPDEVHDTAPESNDFPYFGVNDSTPIKRKRSLKKDIKENVNVLFEQFYSAYPRRVSKEATIRAWSKLMKDPTFNPDRVIEQTYNFAETHRLLQTETRYIPHPSTFLNQRRFEDYPIVDPEGLVAQKPMSKQERKEQRTKRWLEEERMRDAAGDSETVVDIFACLPDGGDHG